MGEDRLITSLTNDTVKAVRALAVAGAGALLLAALPGVASAEGGGGRTWDVHPGQSIQAAVDAGTDDERLVLLKEIGELRIALEQERGGAYLPMPDQQVEEVEGGFRLHLRPLVPAEDWNAQISLLTGVCAADIMLRAGIGLLRTLPTAPDDAVDELRAAFGPDSAAAHRAGGAARHAGPWPGLRTDVDTPQDLAGAGALGERTAAVLAAADREFASKTRGRYARMER